MARVLVYSETVSKKRKVTLKNVTQVIISNHSDVEATFIFQGIKRIIPKKNSVLNIPQGSFEFQSSGHDFDLVLEFNQESYNLVIDYSVLKEKEQSSIISNCS